MAASAQPMRIMVNKLLHEEVQRAAEQLRASLRDLILAAGCEPLKPQAVHRHIGVDRVLCWKVSRMVRAERIEEALLQLPGEEALGIFITAFSPTTAPSEKIEAARAAAVGLNAAIAAHVGDRRTLQLMLDSVPGGQDALAQSRKLLFRGASGLWGIQAKERVQLLMLAPNADNPELVDAATATGWVHVQRMRPDARWRLVRHDVRPGGTPDHAGPRSEQLSASGSLGQSMLLPEFCEDLPPLITHMEGSTTFYELGPSATGRVGAFSLFLGQIQRGLGSRYAVKKGEAAEFNINILAPNEHLTLDVLVHRSLAKLFEGASMSLYSAAFNDGRQFSEFERLGLEPEGVELENLAALENRNYPRYRELLNFTLQRTGWQLEDFIGLRFEVDYPPFPSVAQFRAPLEES